MRRSSRIRYGFFAYLHSPATIRTPIIKRAGPLRGNANVTKVKSTAVAAAAAVTRSIFERPDFSSRRNISTLYTLRFSRCTVSRHPSEQLFPVILDVARKFLPAFPPPTVPSPPPRRNVKSIYWPRYACHAVTRLFFTSRSERFIFQRKSNIYTRREFI